MIINDKAHLTRKCRTERIDYFNTKIDSRESLPANPSCTVGKKPLWQISSSVVKREYGGSAGPSVSGWAK